MEVVVKLHEASLTSVAATLSELTSHDLNNCLIPLTYQDIL